MADIYISQLLSPDEMHRVCEQTGAGVELLPLSIAGCLDRLEDKMAEIKTELAAYSTLPGLTVHGPFLDLNPSTWDTMVYQATLTRFSQAYDAACCLGARKIVYHTGFTPLGNILEGWAERAAAFFREFMQDHHGVEVVMENVLDPQPEPLLEVWEQVGCENFKLCLDIGHAHCRSERSVVEWAQVLLPALSHVHVHDNHGIAGWGIHADEHLGLGRGTIPVRELFSVLRRNSNLTYTIESAAEEDVMASWRMLRDIL